LIVFCSLEEFRKISTGLFFLLTTISNSFHLWTLSTEFLGVFEIYVYTDAFFQCRLNYFVQNVSRAMSTYFAVGIAFDRLIRSEMPMRSRSICTRRNAVIYTIISFIIFSILWSMWLCPMIVRDPVTELCINTKSALLYFFLNQVQTPVRIVIVLIIPIILMIAANTRMLSNMRQSHRRVHNQTVHSTTVVSAVVNGQNIRRMSEIDRMLFFMMLANVGTFIITQIPFHVYTVVRTYYNVLDTFTNSLVRALLLIWSSIYFGVAFYFYCLASPLFREKFVMMSKKLMNFIRRHRA
jgi:uncharacterized integral membrane protein